MGECRMDLVDSELAHMGYEATESYGITWKVGGETTVRFAALSSRSLRLFVLAGGGGSN